MGGWKEGGVGGGGKWEAEGRVKHPFRLKSSVVPSVSDMN